jgi:hypothetical protein
LVIVNLGWLICPWASAIDVQAAATEATRTALARAIAPAFTVSFTRLNFIRAYV